MKENVEVVFYQRENGKIPVREFLFSIPAKLRAKAFKDIELLKKWVYGRLCKEESI